MQQSKVLSRRAHPYTRKQEQGKRMNEINASHLEHWGYQPTDK
jgi:hypothetical protein